VHHLDEFFHRKYAENEATGAMEQVSTAEQIMADQEANAEPNIQLPAPSYWPLILAISLPVIAYGVIFHLSLIVLGVAMVLGSMFGWALEPSMADDDDYDPPSDGESTKELATIG
jgi:cytochrome c oxidase subunit I